MIWLSLLGTAFGASVVINEAMVNPYGSDAGREWVELYNASDAPVALTGWDLRWALSSSTTGEHAGLGRARARRVLRHLRRAWSAAGMSWLS